MKKDEIISAFEKRYATKQFDSDKKISAEDFDFLLKIANLSPTSFGFEPFKIAVIQNKGLRGKIFDFAWGAKRGQLDASHFVLMLSYTRKKLTEGNYLHDFITKVQKMPDDVAKGKEGFWNEFINKDFEIDSDRVFSEWSSRQSYIVLGNMMSAGAMIGIDSCPIEGFNLKAVKEFIKNDLKLDPNLYFPTVMAAFGYRKESQPVKTRREMKEIYQVFE